MSRKRDATSGSEADFRSLPLGEMERRVARFEELVSTTPDAARPSKYLVKRAIRRGAERCPVWLKFLNYDAIVRHGDNLADLFREFPDDLVCIEPYEQTIGYQPPDRRERLSSIQTQMQDMRWVDEWGTRWGHAAGGVGSHQLGYPIADWSQLDDYMANRFPDARAPGRLDAAIPIIKTHGVARYCLGTVMMTLKGRLFSLRGTEESLVDLYANETEVRRLCDAICEYALEMIRQWGELGVDGVLITDDWGTQTALFISPTLWRSIFKPYYRTMFDEIHRAGMDAFFHSCGNITDIVSDLIDIGLDVLHPVQPGAMDVGDVAREFGGRLTFCGTLDTQRLLPFGTPCEIKDEIRRIIDTLGSPFGNGLILAPANYLSADIPIENLKAVFEACH